MIKSGKRKKFGGGYLKVICFFFVDCFLYSVEFFLFMDSIEGYFGIEYIREVI